MFVRHIKKFNNAAEMQAAIASGAIAAPYIAFESSSNIMNMTIPADREPASIEYEEEESLWNSPQLVSNMYTTDSSNGEYTDASGNFAFYYDVDPDSQEKNISGICFYLNSSYLEGWGSTEEYIETNTAAGSNTPLVFITEKGGFDAAMEYWTSPNYGYSESKVLSMLAYNVFNGNETRYDNDGDNTTTWKCMIEDGSETSFWGEDIQYCNENGQSINGIDMLPDESEYYIFVAYRNDSDYPYDAPEVYEASKDNILRAPVDYESMYKVYKAGIFSAYDYSEEEEETPDVSLGYKITKTSGYDYFNSGYVPGTNTVVQIKGVMKKSNDGNEHGMGTSNSGVYQFGVFGFHYPYSNTIYFDHEGYWATCSAELSDVDSATHEYEFGNFYIKVDGTQVATVSSISSTNSNNKEFYIFASNNMDNDGVKGYAPTGAEIEYVKFFEPDASGNLDLQMALYPAIDASGNLCLYDTVSSDVIYPELNDGTFIASPVSSDSSDETIQIEDFNISSNGIVSFTPSINDSSYNGLYYYFMPQSEFNDYCEGAGISDPTDEDVLDYFNMVKILRFADSSVIEEDPNHSSYGIADPQPLGSLFSEECPDYSAEEDYIAVWTLASAEYDPEQHCIVADENDAPMSPYHIEYYTNR